MNQHDNPWNEERVALLHELRPTTTASEISERLGLSEGCIKAKCRRLGLQFDPWPREKEALLRNNWETMNTRQLAELLSCSTKTVLNKAARLGLHRPKPGWPEEDDAILREMWPNNYTIDIATRLGVTRNAVIGRARRLGLENRRGKGWGNGVEASKERKAYNAEQRRIRALGKLLTSQVQKAQNPPIPYATMPEIVVDPLLLSIMDLKSEHCRWPYGEAGSIKYCGHQTLNMQSYCGAHYRMSYQPPRR